MLCFHPLVCNLRFPNNHVCSLFIISNYHQINECMNNYLFLNSVFLGFRCSAVNYFIGTGVLCFLLSPPISIWPTGYFCSGDTSPFLWKSSWWLHILLSACATPAGRLSLYYFSFLYFSFSAAINFMYLFSSRLFVYINKPTLWGLTPIAVSG